MFWQRAKRQAPVVQEWTSEIDELTYAIGDIHGRHDLLMRMLETIKIDAQKENATPRIVFLGDYIDRGPASADVLEELVRLQTATWCKPVILMGNHELFLIKFLARGEGGNDWLEWGGLATLNSYGVSPPADRNSALGWADLRRTLLKTIPVSHMQLLTTTDFFLAAGDYLFVHGGVEPGVPLDEQSSETMLFIREPFLRAERACEYVVVHGHSARPDAENKEWRIGVDTGAYASGVLSAIKLVGREREIIQVARSQNALS